MSVDSVTDGQALVEKLKAERAAKLAKAANGRAAVIPMRPQVKPQPKLAAKSKLEIATPSVSSAVEHAILMLRTM